MRRREFVRLLGVAAAAGPFTTALRVTAQQTAKMPRIGILSPASSEAAATLAAFRKGIGDLGYLEGRTIADFRPRHLRVVGARSLGLDPEEKALLSLLRSWRIRQARAAA